MSKKTSPGITAPKGFRAAGATCGIKASGSPDISLIVADHPCTAAGVFTMNRLASSPVMIGRQRLRSHSAQAIICNSGNANANTGKTGEQNAKQMCELVAKAIGCDAKLVLPSSTGIIGRQLPMDKIARGIATAVSKLSRGKKADAEAARGIMTTDLVPKVAHRSLRLGGKLVQLAGITKGSGMIAPNMATMLAFITTDAAIAGPWLKRALAEAAIVSFNRISVDQHASPSDTAIVLASGDAGNRTIANAGADYQKFFDALCDLSRDLSYQIVKDGEGATKVFRVRVTGARNQGDAERVGKAIVDSPLVKTAVHGGDPNWGRITTAAGYSGAAIDADKLSLHIASSKAPSEMICVYDKGAPTTLDKRTTRRLHKVMAGREIIFSIELRLGKATTEWLGCDLSRQYIAINADYTT